jgi:acyl-CoA reductase-like NAD-dependent aldehyde dehydrogenase
MEKPLTFDLLIGADRRPGSNGTGSEISSPHDGRVVATVPRKTMDDDAFAKGHYYLPTMLTGCTQQMRVMREETFAAVVPFATFATLDEAFALAHDTSYGLVACAFIKEYATIVKLTEALEAGTVSVNHGSVNTNYALCAGWKDSGYGVEFSRRAAFEYLKPKHIMVALS